MFWRKQDKPRLSSRHNSRLSVVMFKARFLYTLTYLFYVPISLFSNFTTIYISYNLHFATIYISAATF